MMISFIFISGIVLFIILIDDSVFAIPIEEIAEEHDSFGHSLASGDFDGDGFDDLAIGVSGEDVLQIHDAGAVNVIYGSQGVGLSTAGNQVWHEDSPGILGVAEEVNYFGFSLTSGDFNGDGFDDLAVGIHNQGIENIPYAGAVNVIYGSKGVGLTATDNQIWDQDSLGILGVAEQADYLGRSLASGDFDGDGFDDLAIGVSGEDVGNIFGAGSINVIYGSKGVGLAKEGNQVWHQDS